MSQHFSKQYLFALGCTFHYHIFMLHQREPHKSPKSYTSELKNIIFSVSDFWRCHLSGTLPFQRIISFVFCSLTVFASCREFHCNVLK